MRYLCFMILIKRLSFPLSIVSIMLFFSCTDSSKNTEGRPQILVTTGMIGDYVSFLTQSFADVQVMMGPGVDPHLYKASQGDMQLLSDANIIIYNGLHLEGKMQEIFLKTAHNKPVIAVSAGIPKSECLLSEGGITPDPHVWMDPTIWVKGLNSVADTLSKLYPEQASTIRKQQQVYEDSLKVLVAEIDELIQDIPKERRVLITSHDAFRYFGKSFDIEVKGLQGISTISEYGLRDIRNMTDLIVERGIRAVFVESSVSHKSLESVVEGCRARGNQVKIGGTLYSDSMGETGTPDGTYTGMLRHNAKTIHAALK